MIKYEILSIDYVDINGLAEYFKNFSIFKHTYQNETNIIFLEKPLELITAYELVEEYFPKKQFELTYHLWLVSNFFGINNNDRIFKIQSFIELRSNLLILLCTQYRHDFVSLSY